MVQNNLINAIQKFMSALANGQQALSTTDIHALMNFLSSTMNSQQTNTNIDSNAVLNLIKDITNSRITTRCDDDDNSAYSNLVAELMNGLNNEGSSNEDGVNNEDDEEIISIASNNDANDNNNDNVNNENDTNDTNDTNNDNINNTDNVIYPINTIRGNTEINNEGQSENIMSNNNGNIDQFSNMLRNPMTINNQLMISFNYTQIIDLLSGGRPYNINVPYQLDISTPQNLLNTMNTGNIKTTTIKNGNIIIDTHQKLDDLKIYPNLLYINKLELVGINIFGGFPNYIQHIKDIELTRVHMQQLVIPNDTIILKCEKWPQYIQTNSTMVNYYYNCPQGYNCQDLSNWDNAILIN